MHTVEAPPQRTNEQLELPRISQLPELTTIERLTLRVCLSLITRIERHASRDRELRARLNAIARHEREAAAERLRRLTPPLR